MKRFFLPFLLLFWSNAATSKGEYPKVEVEESYLKNIVSKLSVDIGPRNHDHYNSLKKASNYIQKEFKSLGYKVVLQKFTVQDKEVENIIVTIGPPDRERIVVGAHYDTFGNQAGADDNASGIAGLLALAKLIKLHEKDLTKRIDFVAFTLEEPPFFRTEGMGSYVHAKSLFDENAEVLGMISLEMIGYFTNEKDSQTYPLGFMRLFYPEEGNFIGIVSNFGSSGLRSKMYDHMSKSNINVRTLAAPSALVGVDFSDHLNYWKFGYDAVMITDTAFYRNPNYHQSTDTIDTLNFKNMTNVVIGVYYGVLNLGSK